MKLKDSIAGQKARADLNDLEIGYKTLQKEQEIALLKKDNKIKNLQLRESGRMKIIYLALLAFLITLFVVVYYQRNQRAKIRTQKIRAELESKMLRSHSQMNPHFIFNSLNSIENFIMQNDKRQASDYLNKFSRLVRSILESSRNEIVPLEKDMEMLKLYIELEQLRFNNKFTYDSYVDPQLFRGDYRVPSLLIQPYVENAIIHGIAHSYDDDLRLSITASLEGEYIKYTIQDNGVGRELAASYNQKNKPGHHSIGLDITAERIALFNKRDHVNGDVSITDLYNENNKPDGTKVEIRLIAT
jgi:sensor histidine kinase YesM